MLKKIILPLALLATLAAGCAPAMAPTVGAKAPDIELFDLDNHIVRLSDYSDRPVIINFWGTQCIYCLNEMAELETAFRQESVKADGVVFLTVNVQDTAATARAFMANNGYTMPALMDAGGRAAQAYGIYAIPVTFLINRAGTISYIKLGSFVSLDEINAALDKVR